MGRPTKKGLNYTFLSIDFFEDLKIKKLVRRTGLKYAPMVYQAIFLAIYAEGYYLVYDEDLPFIISEQLGLDEEDVTTVINACLDLDLLSKEMYDVHGVLTSHGIQSYYNEICSAAGKRHKVVEFSLLEVDFDKDSIAEKNGGFAEKTSAKLPTKGGFAEENGGFAEENGGFAEKTSAKVHEKNRIEKKRKESSFSLTPFPLTEEPEKTKKSSSSPKSVLYYLTFVRNLPNPSQELERIRDYNNLNRKPWDSMSGEQQMAAARMWQQKPPKPPRYTPAFLKFLQQLYDTLQARHPTDEAVQYLLSDSMTEGKTEGASYILTVPKALYELLERDDTALAIIRKYIGRRNLNYKLNDTT